MKKTKNLEQRLTPDYVRFVDKHREKRKLAQGQVLTRVDFEDPTVATKKHRPSSFRLPASKEGLPQMKRETFFDWGKFGQWVCSLIIAWSIVYVLGLWVSVLWRELR